MSSKLDEHQEPSQSTSAAGHFKSTWANNLKSIW